MKGRAIIGSVGGRDVRPESKARIERAAALVRTPVSDFVRSAAEERAERVMAEHDAQTAVPAEFFDDLLAAFDQPARPAPALRRAARRGRGAVSRA
jgi:uncharacterized protein (DUF1778 family)